MRSSASGASAVLGSGASVSVGSGYGETEGLGVGFPWTPPVAALAIVPATMSTANAMRKILSGFMDSVSAGRPRERDWPNG